jgi:hypothetical protein
MITASKIALLASVIFAAGAVTGGLVSSRIASRPAATPLSPPAAAAHSDPSHAAEPRRKDRQGPRTPGMQRLDVFRRIEDNIPMDPQQRDRVRALVSDAERRIHREWEPVMPRIRSELRDLNRRIESELRPDQRARLDSILGRRGNRRTNEAPAFVR